MARIDVLPSIEIIRGFKGILDFYLWRGLPCVRAWPKYRPAKQTPASLAAALTFGAIVKSYALLADLALEAYRQDALDQPRTARDIMVTGVFGNLHEASMSDFLDALIIIRDAVVALTDLLHALDSIDTDKIVVNVDQSVLPPLAATTTHQATQITALEKIDDLQDALESVSLDRLLVRGMDQHFSYKQNLLIRLNAALTNNNGWIRSAQVTAGTVWIVTGICFRNNARATTRVEFQAGPTWGDTAFAEHTLALPQSQRDCWTGLLFLDPGDRVICYNPGGLNGDSCDLEFAGHTMTLET